MRSYQRESSRSDLNDLVAEMRLEFDGFSIRFKDEGYEGLAWPFRAAVWTIRRLHDVLRVERHFDDHYITVFGQTVWFPTREMWEDPERAWANEVVLRHERVHLRDSKGWLRWFFFASTYLLTLPCLYTARYFWEMRAYTENMRAHAERAGEVPESVREWVVDVMVGREYLWMAAPWHRGRVRAHVDRIADEIESEIG